MNVAEQIVAQLAGRRSPSDRGIVGDSLNPIVDAGAHRGSKKGGIAELIHSPPRGVCGAAFREARADGQASRCARDRVPGQSFTINGLYDGEAVHEKTKVTQNSWTCVTVGDEPLPFQN